jgi:hypothetical protein
MRGNNDNRVKGIGNGIGQVLAIQEDGIVGQVYFEVHPDHVTNSSIIVELYGNIDLGLSDCAETGTLLSKSKSSSSSSSGNPLDGNDAFARDPTTGEVEEGNFSWEIFPFPSYNDMYLDQFFECHPRSTGAIMAATEFKIFDPFGISSEGSLWYPAWGDSMKQRGVLQYCVRVIVGTPPVLPPGQKNDEADEEKESDSSYIDTKFLIEGDRNEANFGQSTQGEIRIYSNQVIDSKSAYVMNQEIEIISFLCRIPGNDFVRLPKFGIGDNVSICVGPTEEYASDYEVIGFESVICKNDGQTRNLIDENGVPDALTVVEKNTIGHIDLLKGTTVLMPGILAVRTTITTGMVQLGEESTLCTGEALVEKNSKARHLKQQRGLQTETLEREERGATTISFTMTVNLAKIDNTTFVSKGGKNSSGGASSRWNYPQSSGWALVGSVLVMFLLGATVG